MRPPAVINLNSLSCHLTGVKRPWTHVGEEVTLGSRVSEPSTWCWAHASLGHFLRLNIWQTFFTQTRCRPFTRIYKCFQTDSVKMVSTCLPKGSLVHWPCVMGFHRGRVMRRSVFLGQLAEWNVVFCGREAHTCNAHTQPPFSAHLCSTYFADEQTRTFSACAFMCVLHVWVFYWKQGASVQA